MHRTAPKEKVENSLRRQAGERRVASPTPARHIQASATAAHARPAVAERGA